MTSTGMDGRDLIVRAMVAMASTDGPAGDSEAGILARIYEQVTGEAIAEATVAKAMAERETQRTGLNAALAGAAGRLDRATKEQIVRAAYLVLLSDDAITSPERKTLKEIAHALKIPEVHFGAIMEDLAVWLSRQKR